VRIIPKIECFYLQNEQLLFLFALSLFLVIKLGLDFEFHILFFRLFSEIAFLMSII